MLFMCGITMGEEKRIRDRGHVGVTLGYEFEVGGEIER